jgi:hypothetical protein
LFLTKGSGSLFFESVMPDGFREGELVWIMSILIYFWSSRRSRMGR